jgi:DNA-binding GntR family transcriptional regulator
MSAPRVTLSDSIRTVLEEEIRSGVLAPGSTLDERILIARFKVSRTPAREALLQLVSAGYLESVPRRGMVVTSLSVPEFVASLEVLIDLECLAARLSARRMTAEQRLKLQQASVQGREVAGHGDPAAYAEANRLFHELIYAGCGNPVLADEIRQIRARTRHPSVSMFQLPGRIAASAREHDELVAAVVAGDEEEAGRLMLNHLSRGGTVFVDSVARLSAPADEPKLAERVRSASSQAKAPRKT